MYDERWSDEVVEISSALRSLLEVKCDEAVVRAAEASVDGRAPEVEQLLSDFGLSDLPPEPELLAAVAVELGRSLAPVAWPEVTTVRVVLGIEAAAYALESDPPVGPGSAVVAIGAGLGLVPNEGRWERTGAGDVLVRVDRSAPEERWGAPEAQRLRGMMRLLAAARLAGATRRLLEVGVEYAKTRHAFGKPIGTYQAVSHKLADAAIAAEGAELLVRKTAWLAGRGADGTSESLFAHMAWNNAVDAGRGVSRIVHQCMGGSGATIDYPAQLYSRRIRSWALRLGRPADGYRKIARTLLDPAARDAVVGLWHEERGITVPRWALELDRTVRADPRGRAQ